MTKEIPTNWQLAQQDCTNSALKKYSYKPRSSASLVSLPPGRKAGALGSTNKAKQHTQQHQERASQAWGAREHQVSHCQAREGWQVS